MIQNQTLQALKRINWNNLKGERGILSSLGESFRKHSVTYVDCQSSYLFFKKKNQLIYGKLIEFTIFPSKSYASNVSSLTLKVILNYTLLP